MMDITVVQPRYRAGENPDEAIARFLLRELNAVRPGGLIVLPEYSNAGGLSDPEAELAALPRAEVMKRTAAEIAGERGAYVAVNVLERREDGLWNSTYLYGTDGIEKFVYDKIHLPPSEVALGVNYGGGACVCDVDGLRFAFMTCYDVYYNEQIEYIAAQKPDIILIPGYQRGERTDIIRAQNKLTAFRCNAYIARSSFSMDDEEHGGCSMIVSPDGEILQNMGADVGSITVAVEPTWKYMRTAGFGGGMVRNDDFVNDGLRPEVFR